MHRRTRQRPLYQANKTIRRRLSKRAVALTVFRSPTMNQFSVNLIGTLPDGGTAGIDLVLGRASGGIIDLIGGVPFGASGSPVYQNRRLIGAISTIFSPDFKLVGITPIDAMLAMEREPMLETGPSTAPSRKESPHRMTAVGISSERLLKDLADHYGIPQVASRAHKTRTAEPLKPGSPVGAALLIGDIELGFIGTTTEVAGRRVFAFGHPLLFAGPTNMPLTTATILDTARGDFPTKIGDFGQVIGTVLQDRSAGIFALLEVVPRLVQMRFDITDEDRHRTEAMRIQAAHIPSELPFLTLIAGLESMQRAMNRVGAGTATWEWIVRVQDIEEPIIVNETQYDGFDIGFAVASSVLGIIEQILQEGRVIESVELVAQVTIRNLTLDT